MMASRFFRVVAAFVVIFSMGISPGLTPPAKASQPVDHLLISTIQIGGGSSTDEFIEIFNPTTAAIDLASWRLTKRTATGSESNLLTTFPTLLIASGATLRIAHATGYTGIRNADAHYSTSGSIANNNAVLLYSDQGHTLVDTVGWGTAVGEGVSASTPLDNGQITRRLEAGLMIDTNDNAADFLAITPPAVTPPDTTPTDPPPTDVPETPVEDPPTEPTNTNGPPGHAVISAIQIGGVSSTDEFVEIFNPTVNALPMLNWRLTKRTAIGTESNLLTTFPEATLASGATFRIAHPTGYTGTHPANASYSTSGSLATNNAVLLYSDQGETLVDLVGLGTAIGEGASAPNPEDGFVLTRNEVAEIIVDTNNNASDFTIIDPSAMVTPPDPTPTDTETDPQPSDDNSTETATESTTYIPAVHDVIINEFMAAPSGEDEWVEIYNRTDHAIDLTDWKLTDGGDHRTSLSGTLGTDQANRFLVITNPNGNLNNSGDKLSIIAPSGTIIDAVAYGDWDDGNTNDNAPAGSSSLSVARRTDGLIEGSSSDIFATTNTPTRGTPNVIANPQAQTTTTSTNTGGSGVSYSSGTTSNTTPTLIINEMYPNPTGSDDQEFIEIKNTGTVSVTLTDWQLTDNHGGRYVFALGDAPNLTLSPGDILAVSRAVTHLALLNEGATISLKMPTNSVMNKITYDTATEGQSWALVDGRWRWTASPTLGQNNVYTHGNQSPVARIIWPTNVTIGEQVAFSAEDTTDPDNDSLLITWEFSDGIVLRGSMVNRRFEKNGKYQANVIIDDQHGGVIREQRAMTVTGVVLGATTQNSSAAATSTKAATTKSTSSSAKAATKTASTSSKGVTIRGIVAAPPQTIHAQYAYLINVTGDVDGSTIILDARLRPLPQLSTGDIVTATGDLASSSGPTAQKRLVVTEAALLTITSPGETPIPTSLETSDASTAIVGALVSTKGTIVSSTDKSASLATTGGETLRLVAPLTLTAWNLTDNTSATATGILQSSASGWRLLLRSNDDLVTEQTTTTLTATNQAPTYAPPSRQTAMLITALGTLLALGLIGYQQRHRLQSLFGPKRATAFSGALVADDEDML